MAEYVQSPVPAEARQPFWKILAVSLGLTAVAVNMLVGGALGAAMAPSEWASVIVLGGVILAGIAGYTAAFSYSTGRSFALQTEQIFGALGSRVVAGFVGLIILGWYTIQASLLGHALTETLSLPEGTEPVLLFLTPLLLASTAMAGFRGLTWLSSIAVPAIFVFSLIAVFRPAVTESPASVESTIPWTVGITMVIALWIMGAVATIGDVTRYASSRTAAVSAAVIAFLVGNTGLMLAGAWAARKYGAADLSQVLSASGLPVLGLLLLVANIWSTNDNSIYSIGLNWGHATKKKYAVLVLCAALLSAVASVFRPYESQLLSSWLSGLGVVVPAIGGVIVGRRVGGGGCLSFYHGRLSIGGHWCFGPDIHPIWSSNRAGRRCNHTTRIRAAGN